MSYLNYLLITVLSLFYISCGIISDEPEVETDEILQCLLEQSGNRKCENHEYSILHISDLHGSAYTLKYFIDLLNRTDAVFGLITGDIMMADDIYSAIVSCNKPIYLLPGNHDVYEYYNEKGQVSFKNDILNKLIKPNDYIVFGDKNANYYYVDFSISGHNNRLICLDQFEIDAVDGDVIKESVVMSQKQVDWFINTLMGSRSFDSIIIAMHEGFGNSAIGQRDTSNRNSFISLYACEFEESYDYYSKYGDPRLIPDIIEAYRTGTIINNKYSSGKRDYTLNVTAEFNEPCDNFVAYFGGHMHIDIVEHLKNYTEQLQFIITTANPTYSSKYDDLIRTTEGIDAIAINRYYINTQSKCIETVRLGARKIANGNLRDSIIFRY